MSHDQDPLAELDRLVKRQTAEEEAAAAIARARTALILGTTAKSVFFATLALRLRPEPDWTTQTMATDGRGLFYNPEWTNALPPDERTGVVVHEVMHCAMAHHARRCGRDPEGWNVAADLAINQLIVDSGMKLPACGLYPGKGQYAHLPPGLSAEEYYSLLQKKGGQGGNGQGQGGGTPTPGQGGGTPDPGGCGGVRDPGQGNPADAAQSEADWKQALAEARNAAKTRGDLPGGLGVAVDAVVNPPADWRAVLREFVSKWVRSGCSWTSPNRRFVAQGLYLPGKRSQALGEVVVAVDCSGSVGPDELGVFANELNAILDAYPCTVSVVYHDAVVLKVDEHSTEDGPLALEPVGGGGTDHGPVFEWLAGHDGEPACVVALTDLVTSFGSVVPDAPVLWAVTGGCKTKPPFGSVVHLTA
jgi:predicted metal-dependent peptidase